MPLRNFKDQENGKPVLATDVFSLKLDVIVAERRFHSEPLGELFCFIQEASKIINHSQ